MTGNDPTTPKPAPMLTNSMTEGPMTNEPKALVVPPMKRFHIPEKYRHCTMIEADDGPWCFADEAQAQARRANEAEAAIAKYAADDVRYLGVLAAKDAERDALKARVAELEKRETNDYDCRMVGRLAEMGGSHCPLGNPCQRCQLEGTETTLARRDREIQALREALKPWGSGGVITGTVLAWIAAKDPAIAKAIVYGKATVDSALASTAKAAILGTESGEAQP